MIIIVYISTLALMLLTTFTATAQTNYGTVDFTNKYGGRISGQVLRVNATTFQIKQDGIVSLIKFTDTPTNIQTRLGYDPEVEASARKAKAEREAARGLAAREAAYAAWLKEPTPKPDKGAAHLEVKITEKNSVYWQMSYVLTLRNPTADDMKRDYTINYLDKEGFVIDSSDEYNVTTPAQSTNIVRGVSMITVPKAYDYHKPEIVSSLRK